MSYLFMDLYFDVLCVFQKDFGPLPSQNNINYDWLEKQALLLDVELQFLIKDKYMEDEKIRLNQNITTLHKRSYSNGFY